MSHSEEKEKTMNSRFDLPAELTIYSAAETREALLGWLSRQRHDSGMLELGASAVTEVDGAGLQVLAAFHTSVHLQGHTWTLFEPSAVLVSGCRTLGMSLGETTGVQA